MLPLTKTPPRWLGVGAALLGAVAAAHAATPPPDPADVPAPRSDHGSELAHLALVQKAARGDVDIYFEGDSITRRWDAEEPAYRNLRENWTENFSGWKVSDFGWGADKLQNILWRLDHGELDGVHPQVFVLLAGTNNVGEIPQTGTAAEETAAVTKGLAAILRRLQAKAPHATIVLVGLFPRGDEAAEPKMAAINAINAELARWADGKQLRYLNLNDQLTDASGQIRPEMFNPDRLHPTVKAYQIWADRLKPIFAEVVGPPARPAAAQ